MHQVGARVDFRPGCGRLESAFEEHEREQKRLASAGYHHRDPMCMWYRDSLPGPDPGGTLAIDLKDGDGLFCSGDKIYRLGGSRLCVFVNVDVRHRRQVGQVQGSIRHSH